MPEPALKARTAGSSIFGTLQDPEVLTPGEFESTLVGHPHVYKGEFGNAHRNRDRNVRVPWQAIAHILQVGGRGGRTAWRLGGSPLQTAAVVDLLFVAMMGLVCPEVLFGATEQHSIVSSIRCCRSM